MAGKPPEPPPGAEEDGRPAAGGGDEGGASPPCFAGEAEPDYMLARPMDRAELAGFVGALLDAERRLADALGELERAGRLPRADAARVKAETAPMRARLSAQAARLGGAIGVRAPERAAAAPGAGRGGDPVAALGALLRFVLGEIDRALPLVEDRDVAALLEEVRAAHRRALAAAEPGDGRRR